MADLIWKDNALRVLGRWTLAAPTRWTAFRTSDGAEAGLVVLTPDGYWVRRVNGKIVFGKADTFATLGHAKKFVAENANG